MHAGEIVAVVGASGSGKTLLADAVLGLFEPNATVRGRIWFDGELQDAAGLAALRGNGVSLVPQSVNNLDPLMKVGRQVEGFAHPDVPHAERRRRRAELFERYGLSEETAQLYPFELSGGMARRVLLCCALMDDPRVIVADEPTPGLDLDLAVRALDDFRAFADAGGGVMLITHDMSWPCTWPTAWPCSKTAPWWRRRPSRTSHVPTRSRTRSRARCGMRCRSTGFATATLARVWQGRFPCLRRGASPTRIPVRRARSTKASTWQLRPTSGWPLCAPSGFGKTPLCRRLAGYERPQAGEVRGDGEPLPRRGACPVQMIWQHPEAAVDPRMRMGATLAEAGEVPGRLLDDLGIQKRWLSRYPHELSGGELQRFCITRALAANPRYLVADEVSTMLDALTQAQIWRFLVGETSRRGIGLVFVSHSPPSPTA